MKAYPEGVDERILVRALSSGWDLQVAVVEYFPVGFGSYHWLVDDVGGRRHFITVDDLAHKPWLGRTSDASFEGLGRAFDTAVALRRQGGLGFVVALLPTIRAESVRRLSRRHAIALFPFVKGRSAQFGDEPSSTNRAEVLDLLVELHGANPALCTTPRRGIGLPGRHGLEEALADRVGRWRGGPFAAPARDWLASHAAELRRLLDNFDGLAEAVKAANPELVITHGETHYGNFMQSRHGLALVDWDTVELAPPERDLWHVATAEGDELARYADATGHAIDETALSMYRLGWDLKDVAIYVELFRAPHSRTEDTEKAWRGLIQSNSLGGD